MRPLPILTALLTVVILFLLVFQRDAVNRFVSGNPTPVETAETEAAGGESAAGHTAISVIAVTSRAQDIDSAVVLRGETAAGRMVTVLSETAGRVIDVMIDEGANVSQDDVLCELDPGASSATLAQARAAVTEAEKNLATAEQLSEGGFRSETSVLSVRAAYESALAALEQAQLAVDNLKIRAPFDGIVDGDVATVGSYLTPGSPCATLVQLDPIQLVGYVAETDVNRIATGAQVGARLATGQQVIGSVSYIGRSADPVTRTFKVEAEAPNPDLAIRDGQSTEMLIAAAGRSAHLLPQSSLTLNDEGLLGVRTVAEDQTAEFMEVELVRDSVDGVWVAGLPETVDVIVVGQEYVTDGVEIDVTMRESGT